MRTVFTPLIAFIVCFAAILPAQLSAQEEEEILFSEQELDQMLAPVALYPDSLLAQVLIAATYPLEVVQATRWIRDNPGLKEDTRIKAAESKDWDPSVQSLVSAPEILEQMDKEIEWTQKVGDAFLMQEEDVMDSIQRLRNRAYATGNLQQQEHIRVVKEREIIVIQPANPQVVYVPYYQPVVYGNWWYPAYPPVYWAPPPARYSGVHLGFYWSSGVRLSHSFFYTSWNWPSRHVVVNVHHHYYRHRYPSYSRVSTGPQYVRWRHHPEHRRGVAYRSERLNRDYGRYATPSSRPTRSYSERDRDSNRRSNHISNYERRSQDDVRNRIQSRGDRSDNRGNLSSRGGDARSSGRDSTAGRNNTPRDNSGNVRRDSTTDLTNRLERTRDRNDMTPRDRSRTSPGVSERSSTSTSNWSGNRSTGGDTDRRRDADRVRENLRNTTSSTNSNWSSARTETPRSNERPSATTRPAPSMEQRGTNRTGGSMDRSSTTRATPPPRTSTPPPRVSTPPPQESSSPSVRGRDRSSGSSWSGGNRSDGGGRPTGMGGRTGGDRSSRGR